MDKIDRWGRILNYGIAATGIILAIKSLILCCLTHRDAMPIVVYFLLYLCILVGCAYLFCHTWKEGKK